MRLTVVGCSGSFPGPESAASCYLLEVDHDGTPFRVVVDLGNGALGSLQRHTDIYRVDAVLLTHLHADHCVDVTAYYTARKYRPEGPASRLPVYGPRGTAQQLAAAYGLRPESGMGEEFDFRCYPDRDRGGTFELGPLLVTAVRMAHPVPCFGFRLQHGGRTLAFTADTGPTPALATLADGVDLLLAEASFAERDDNPPGLHLTGRQAGQVAQDAGAARLVLTHVPPWHSPAIAVEEAAEVYDGPLVAARPGQHHDV